jgi:type I site-specific restriction endonuclease
LDNLNANKQENEDCHSTILDKKEEVLQHFDN